MYCIRCSRTVLAAFLVTLLIPAAALAQTGSIAGQATDETGGVIPGVTVEASSPALIEGVRVTVTDGSGLYEIEALRPGSYTVTFTLPGFNTFVRDGIELVSGFTANIDGRMSVGSIEETVTVTGASPLIDVQNVVSQQNLSRDDLDVLPTGKTYWGYAALTVGMNTNIAGGGHDVGGSIGDAWGHVSIHGSDASDGVMAWDGMSFNNNIGDGAGSSKQFFLNQAAIQEIVMSTSDMNAETPFGGVGVNAIPKEGGNAYSYYVNVAGTSGDLQAGNLNDELRARGVTTQPKVRKIWDYGIGVGGPIVRDRIWFYTAHRWWGTQNFVTSSFTNTAGRTFPNPDFASNPDALIRTAYAPDRNNPNWTDFFNQDNGIRLTFQAGERHKLTLSQHHQRNCACHFYTQYGIVDNHAAVDYTYYPINLTQTTYTFPVSNRLLIEAGGSFLRNLTSPRQQDTVMPWDVAYQTISPFVNWGSYARLGGTSAPAQYGRYHDFPNYVFRGSMSYVSGSHNFKVGFDTRHAEENHGLSTVQSAVRLDLFTATTPYQVTQFSSPFTSNQTSNESGIYAQDQWTIDRLTLNLGVRFDHLNAYVPAQELPDYAPAPRFVPAPVVERIDNLPNYNDISPRLGFAYDLSGNGRTALKGSLGRYVLALGTTIAQSLNPMEAIVTETNRSWADANANLWPDCELENFGANGECGAVRNPEFGDPSKVILRADPGLLEGWGIREYQWQNSLAVQHELSEGWSVEVGWFRTSYGNFRVGDNTSITPDDFQKYSISAPNDPRLEGVSGTMLTDLYTISPEGQAKGSDIVLKLAQDVPGGDVMSQVFNGIDFTFNGRLENGITLGGGVSAGAMSYNECFIIDSPQQIRPGYCELSEPWSAGTQIKLNGAVPLPYDTQVSFVFQNLAGLPWQSAYRVPAAAVAAGLEDPTGQVVVGAETVQLLPAGRGTTSSIFNKFVSSTYEPRLTQLDVRFSKIFQLGQARLRGWVDLFNIFNANNASNLVTSYGGPDIAFPRISQVMGGRMLKLGGQFDF